jgi:hypothetical protein
MRTVRPPNRWPYYRQCALQNLEVYTKFSSQLTQYSEVTVIPWDLEALWIILIVAAWLLITRLTGGG